MSYDCECTSAGVVADLTPARAVLKRLHNENVGEFFVSARKDCPDCGGTGRRAGLDAGVARSQAALLELRAAEVERLRAANRELEAAVAAKDAGLREIRAAVLELEGLVAERQAELLDAATRADRRCDALAGRLDLATTARDRYRVEAERLADELRDVAMHALSGSRTPAPTPTPPEVPGPTPRDIAIITFNEGAAGLLAQGASFAGRGMKIARLLGPAAVMAPAFAGQAAEATVDDRDGTRYVLRRPVFRRDESAHDVTADGMRVVDDVELTWEAISPAPTPPTADGEP